LQNSSNHQTLTKTADEGLKAAAKASKVIKKASKRCLVTHNTSENHQNVSSLQPTP